MLLDELFINALVGDHTDIHINNDLGSKPQMGYRLYTKDFKMIADVLSGKIPSESFSPVKSGVNKDNYLYVAFDYICIQNEKTFEQKSFDLTREESAELIKWLKDNM